MNLDYNPCTCQACVNRLADGVSEYQDQDNQSFTTYGQEMSVSMLKDVLSTLPNHATISGLIGYEIKAGTVYLTVEEGK